MKKQKKQNTIAHIDGYRLADCFFSLSLYYCPKFDMYIIVKLWILKRLHN